MHRTIGLLTLIVLGCLDAGEARSDGNGPSKDVLALQQAIQDAIAEAEPSVACILVSRSPRYKEYGAAPPVDKPGQLGDFHYDYNRLDRRDLNYVEKKRQIQRLDLASGSTAPESFGSGVVIDDKERLILTNYHVVLKASKVYVRLPGGKGSYANIHAADPRSDLAVLHLIDDKIAVKPIKIGNADKVKKGQLIVTLANPYAAGFRDGSPSSSWGIISNIRRLAPNSWRNELDPTKTLHHYGTLLQTDSRIGLGCSGGALLDLHGNLIGLTTALAAVAGTDTPGGFAVPMDACMRRIIETLKQGKEVEYGFLGVQFNNPAEDKGVMIDRVIRDSPAALAGLQAGDKIVALNGVPVNQIDDIVLPLAGLGPGSIARLEIVRNLKKQPWAVVVGKFFVRGPIIASNRSDFRGIRVDHTSLLCQQDDEPKSVPPGVFVHDIIPNSPASAVLTLRPRQVIVITKVNGRPVKSPEDFFKAVKGRTAPVELSYEENQNGQEKKVKIN
jgi:S1-C subfamily serine protease